MDALPLPPRPNLDQYRKRAKELTNAARAGDAGAVRAWASDWLTALTQTLDMTAAPNFPSLLKQAIDVLVERTQKKIDAAAAGFALADAQHLIATIHGFENWAAFARYVDTPSTGDSRGREFDLVNAFVADKETLASGVPLAAPPWRHLAANARTHIEAAFVYACRFERVDVAIGLLDLGVDVAAADGQKMTALHHAAAHGLIDLVRALVARGAPLEVENVWGGTVLDSTAYFAEFAPIKGVDYAPVLQMLVDAGADVRVLDEYPADGKVVPEFRARLGRRGA